MIIPVKKCIWGQINSVNDLRKYVEKSGQFFGQDLSGPACNFDASYPCDQTLYHYKGWGLHKGIDIPVATGTEIYAATDGVVVETSDDLSAGIGVVLYDQVQSLKTVYWHLQTHIVKMGDRVKQGDLIGYSDNTGWSAGPHLHFEVKVCLLNGNTDTSVGLQGAIDPFTCFTKVMSETEVKNLYRLAFYRLPDATELAFWEGKSLDEFLKVAIQDRAKFLEASL